VNARSSQSQEAQLFAFPTCLCQAVAAARSFLRHRSGNGIWFVLISIALFLSATQTPAQEHGDRPQNNENARVRATPSDAGGRTDYLSRVPFSGSWKGRLNFYPANAPDTQSPCSVAISPGEKTAALYSEQMPEGRNPAAADRQGAVLRWTQRLPSGFTASFTMELVAEGYAVVDMVVRWEKGKKASLPPVVGSGNFVKQ
jgi:hypothetical protein